jgi:tRNA pseudouridine38-40 synthase
MLLRWRASNWWTATPRTIRLLLAYDGTRFRGWAAQRDPGIRTIEGELRALLSLVFGEPIELSVAGRTDAGVHAEGQVASFITTAKLPGEGRERPGRSGRSPRIGTPPGSVLAGLERLQGAINGQLGPEISCLRASLAPEGFDARFWATARHYRYRIDTALASDPFTARYVWHHPRALSVGAMRAGARELLGKHDFTAFCRKPPGGKSTLRTLHRIAITRSGDRVELGFEANAFLHRMVRSLTGALVAVGEGKLPPPELGEILAARDRKMAPDPAPASGLTLERVIYGRRPELPKRL